MIIASWNVNSIKMRLDNVLSWLAQNNVDVLLLQELKGESFPHEAFEQAGYAHRIVVGQKAYNGVAMLSRHKIENEITKLPEITSGDDTDVQARFCGGTVNGVDIFGLYLPNGNPVDTEKYSYKLSWMERLYSFAAEQISTARPVVFGGDFNVIPAAIDAKRPDAWKNDALFLPQTRKAWQRIINIGYADAFRIHHPDMVEAFSFWDYQAGAWPKNDGIRIDHFLLSPEAVDKMQRVWIDRGPRGEEKASDHTPVCVEIAL